MAVIRWPTPEGPSPSKERCTGWRRIALVLNLVRVLLTALVLAVHIHQDEDLTAHLIGWAVKALATAVQSLPG